MDTLWASIVVVVVVIGIVRWWEECESLNECVTRLRLRCRNAARGWHFTALFATVFKALMAQLVTLLINCCQVVGSIHGDDFLHILISNY